MILLPALLAALGTAPVAAGPPSGGHSAPGRWAGGAHAPVYRPDYRPVYRPVHRPVYGPAYRPVYWPGYGGWWYGYPAYGFGLGLGLGYGAGWSVGYGFPAYYGSWSAYAVNPYGYGYGVRPAPLGWNDDLVYVEQPQPVAPAPQRPSGGFWYYCADPAGYHPYVQRCSQPWIAVQPQPSPAAP